MTSSCLHHMLCGKDSHDDGRNMSAFPLSKNKCQLFQITEMPLHATSRDLLDLVPNPMSKLMVLLDLVPNPMSKLMVYLFTVFKNYFFFIKNKENINIFKGHQNGNIYVFKNYFQ